AARGAAGSGRAVRPSLRERPGRRRGTGPGLSFVAASQGSLASAVGERLRARSYALVHVHGPWLAQAVCLAGLLSPAPPLLVSLREPPRAIGMRRWMLGRALARATAIVTCC